MTDVLIALWMDLAERITQSERAYQDLAEQAWRSFDVTKAMRYRGMAEGLAMARDHQLEIAAEARREGVMTVDVDTLPPTQYLILEVLAARYRCGETLWTFPTSVGSALRALEEAGLLATMHGVVPKTIRARLTDAGTRAWVSPTYNAPAPTLAQGIDSLPADDDAYYAWMRRHRLGHGAGIATVISAVRRDLQAILER